MALKMASFLRRKKEKREIIVCPKKKSLDKFISIMYVCYYLIVWLNFVRRIAFYEIEMVMITGIHTQSSL